MSNWFGSWRIILNSYRGRSWCEATESCWHARQPDSRNSASNEQQQNDCPQSHRTKWYYRIIVITEGIYGRAFDETQRPQRSY